MTDCFNIMGYVTARFIELSHDANRLGALDLPMLDTSLVSRVNICPKWRRDLESYSQGRNANRLAAPDLPILY